MTFHETAEALAREAVAPAIDVPLVTYDQAVKPAAPLVMVLLPATMAESIGSVNGAVRATMLVQLAATATGETGAPVGALTALTDQAVTALYRAGFQDISTSAGYADVPDLANPRPARTITASIQLAETS